MGQGPQGAAAEENKTLFHTHEHAEKLGLVENGAEIASHTALEIEKSTFEWRWSTMSPPSFHDV